MNLMRFGDLSMKSQCPVCYSTLEVRDVTPCMICGGWTAMVEKFEASAVFGEWRLPSGEDLVLCAACELEEFMVTGGWGFRLGLPQSRLPINYLKFVKIMQSPEIGKDKFCPECNLRLAFLKVVAAVPK